MGNNPSGGFTDIHLHFCDTNRLDELISFCDTAGINKAGLVSLPDEHAGNFNSAVHAAFTEHPDRFIGFGCLDHRLEHTGAGGAAQVTNLHQSGFTGLKLWIGKPAAEQMFNVRMEDDYINVALKASADLDMPVLLHLADPPDFWKTSQARNSQNLKTLPGSFGQWIDRGIKLFSRHPDVKFIGAHLLFLAGSLKNLDQIMASCPNLNIDTAPGRWFYRGLAEQPEEARKFFAKWKKRILFGSDSMFFPAAYNVFPPGNIKSNLITANRIKDFLSTDNSIDDPYPWSDYKDGAQNLLEGLNLDNQVLDLILNNNAENFFKRG